jgi:hypothetical protein
VNVKTLIAVGSDTGNVVVRYIVADAFHTPAWQTPTRLILFVIRHRKQAILRREFLQTLIAIAISGFCGCGRDKTAKRPNMRQYHAEVDYLKALVAKVQRGWDGDVSAAPKRGGGVPIPRRQAAQPRKRKK